MTIKRGEVVLAALDPVLGHEISKTRPVVVVSNDINNEHSPTLTVVPLTSKHLDRIYPFEIVIPKGHANLPKTSKAKADQIRTLDKRRIIKSIGMLSSEQMAQLDAAMRIHLWLC